MSFYHHYEGKTQHFVVLKNITLATKLRYMGYKIEIDAVVVSIWTNGFFMNMTIRGYAGRGD